MGIPPVMRLLTRGAAVVVLTVSLLATFWAVAVSPLGAGARELVGETTGSCDPEWIELAQLVPALTATGLSDWAAIRGGPKRAVTGALLLVIGWSLLGVVGECNIGSDEAR